MKKAILIHGWGDREEFDNLEIPTASNCHWFPWVSKRLMVAGVHAVAIEMPNSYYPEYEVWKKELERFELDKETVLVGHSCGAGFLVRYLSEEDVRVRKVVLVAPWLGIKYEWTEPFDQEFFEFEIDRDLVEKTVDGVVLVESTNDMPQINESVEVLKEKVDGMRVVKLEGCGHFILKHMETEEFPELVEEVLR
ncbi:alpha/beta hydrolase [Candidatus Saccharibacteria bacterium]|nr:alpha/beta hydrolase [Candidatus Saccharibacteria bacterium]